MLKSHLMLKAISKFSLYMLIILTMILPSIERIVYATSQNMNQTDQVYLPFVSNNGGATDNDSIVIAAGNLSDQESPDGDSKDSNAISDQESPDGDSNAISDQESPDGDSNAISDQANYADDKIIFIGTQDNINECLESSYVHQHHSHTFLAEILMISSTLEDQEQPEIIQIYDINSEYTVMSLVQIANKCPGVSAEPNYIYSAHSISGQLGSPAGSNSAYLGGNPWSTGGSRIAITNTISITNTDFYNQPVFNLLGIMNSSKNRVQHDSIIGIFDTMPATITSPSGVIVGGNQFMGPYDSVGNLSCSSTNNNMQLIKEHGVNVLSIAKAASPTSSMYLYRALNHCGRGDLESLMLALNDFMTATNSYNKRTINMSLGAPAVPMEIVKLTDSHYPVSLGIQLNSIRAAGVTIVASSGNGSANVTAKVAEWPAAYNSVLGVAASSGLSGRSCYSNRGDIAAPGGYSDVHVLNSNTTVSVNPISLKAIDNYSNTIGCEPQMNSCSAGSDKCIIAQTSTGGFNYVKGTSFASPLVAGMLAHQLASQPSSNVDINYACVKAGAFQTLYTNTLGAGIATQNFSCS